MPALSVTFDNLGEAAELELGLWPEGKALGGHPSVERTLPRLLSLLGRAGVRATFFVEAINAELYQEALHSIAAAGHEVACHAWRHEEWGSLDETAETELIERATGALAKIGLPPVGFRPPGGRMGERTAELLRASGYCYASPCGQRASVDGSLVLLPFSWKLVDAWYHYPRAGGLRGRLVGDEKQSRRTGVLPARVTGAAFRVAVRAGAIRGAGRMRAAMVEQIDALARDGGHRALVFHPFLLGWRRTERALADVLEHVAGLTGELRVATMAEVAGFEASL
jgi:peptidoglycan/xylan/chitin deacetylase (PgdA/CDA1 family)